MINNSIKKRLKKLNIIPNNNISNFAIEDISFVLLNYCLWIINSSHNNNIHTLYFLARDGYILKRISQILIEKLGYKIECKYLYVSRQSLRICNIMTLEKNLKWILKKSNDGCLSLNLMLKRLSLPFTPEIKTIANEYNIDLEKESKEKLIKFLKDERINSIILQHSKIERNEAKNYFISEGLANNTNYALVDIGWQGRIPKIIMDILDLKSLNVYYFGNLNPNKDCSINLNPWLFSFDVRKNWYDFFDKSIAVDLLEILTSANHESLLSYSELREGLPIDKKSNELINWGIEDYHSSIIKYTEEITYDELQKLDNIYTRECVLNTIKRLIEHPTKLEAKILGDFLYSSEQTDTLKKYFAPKIKLRQCFNDDKLKIVWLEGSYKRSNIVTQKILSLKMKKKD